MTTTTMPNYMILHASAYPPLHWSFLANRQSQNSRASNIKHKNELWTKMTNHYEQSMTERQHHVDSNALSKTATADNISKMRPNVKELYRPLPPTNFEDAARVKVWRSKERFFEKMDKLAGNLKKIPEDKTGTTELPQRLTEREWRRDKQAISNAKVHRDLLDDEDANIEIPFRKRLDVIYDVHYNFICSSRSNRPRWAQLCRMHREVTDHVARVTYAKEQLKSDVTLMSTFLREQLFDQYCLMRDTPMEKKDETWLQCGKFLNLGMEIGDWEVVDRIDRMIDGSGLDVDWVIDRLEDYYNGNDHIGRWQRLMEGRRWNELAAKLTVDKQQLDKINSTIDVGGSRKCNIMPNIYNTMRQFFKALEGAQDFELSEKALRMDGEDERASNPSPTALVSPVNEDVRRRNPV